MDITEYLQNDIEKMRSNLLEIEAEYGRLGKMAEQQRGALAYSQALLQGIVQQRELEKQQEQEERRRPEEAKVAAADSE